MDENTTQFIPFHAINEFMRDDFRLDLIRSTLNALIELPVNYRDSIESLTKKLVQVPGFRNSAKAPIGMRIKPTLEAFMKSSSMVAAILSAWCEAHPELRQQVYDLLCARGWEILPIEADRSRLPGFLMKWPDGEDFDKLYEAYLDAYPSSQTGPDDVSLMIVWLSDRLPYQSADDDQAS